MGNSTKNSILNAKDYMNIQTALRYTASDMVSDYFRDNFLNTLYKIIRMEGEYYQCIVKE